MTASNQYEYLDCAGQIRLAHRIITLSLPCVKSLFPDREFSEAHDSYDGIEGIWLEVKFDLFTLTCLFDNSCICKGVFLDDLKQMVNYKDYCSQAYDYDSDLNGWMIGHCCITIEAGSLVILQIVQETPSFGSLK